jgi:dsRNA-specific ribonuclease
MFILKYLSFNFTNKPISQALFRINCGVHGRIPTIIITARTGISLFLELKSAGAGSESLLAIVFHNDCLEFRGNATGEYFLVGVLYNSFLESAGLRSAFRTEVLVRGIARYN